MQLPLPQDLLLLLHGGHFLGHGQRHYLQRTPSMPCGGGCRVLSAASCAALSELGRVDHAKGPCSSLLCRPSSVCSVSTKPFLPAVALPTGALSELGHFYQANRPLLLHFKL
jgi:hypothetical protein